MSKRRRGRRREWLRGALVLLVGAAVLQSRAAGWLEATAAQWAHARAEAWGAVGGSDGMRAALAAAGSVGAAIVLVGIVGAAWALGRGRRRRRLAGITRERLLAMTPGAFEGAVADLLAARGWTGVRVVGGAGDLGVDVTGRDPDGRPGIVQCKRYAQGRAVTSSEVQLFLGRCLLSAPGGRWIYATTSCLTRPATALAAAHGLEVLAGDDLAGAMVAAGQGGRGVCGG